jgi:hypothetical protein
MDRSPMEVLQESSPATTVESSPVASRLGQEAWSVVWLLLQLSLLGLVIRFYKIEDPAFRHSVLLMFSGCVIHHYLPLAFKLPFFIGISIGSLYWALGVADASWLLIIAMTMIGICHLPIRFGVRVAMVIAMALGLAAIYSGWCPIEGSATVFSIFGSMFMFRLMIYLYDLKHEAAPFTLWRSMAYFLMVPNLHFSLYPIIDYKTFCRTYYNQDAHRIYQTGLKWISRGLLHLVLYRVVYQLLLPDPMDIHSAGDLFRYMAFTFMLYLKISGQYHLIVGLLHLFGFNLPETNHLWLIPTSFVDLWRRINIYWKEYIMKIFFYPAYFYAMRWKSPNSTKAILFATIYAMVLTWILHRYQWFWLKGEFPIPLQDTIFWIILGTILTVNVMLDNRAKVKGVAKTAHQSVPQRILNGFKSIGVFTTLIVLWSMWRAESYSEWFALMSYTTQVGVSDVLVIGSMLLTIGLASFFFGHTQRQWTEDISGSESQSQALWSRAGVIATCVLVLAPLIDPIHAQIEKRLPEFAMIMTVIQKNTLNITDTNTLHRGYYEDLTQLRKLGLKIDAPAGGPDAKFKLEMTDAVQATSDYRQKELKPSCSVVFNGAKHTINPFGMRDRLGYSQAKPEGVYRIAVMGASDTLGWGVGDLDTYENLVEDRLNAENDKSQYDRYEMLNLSVNGYGPVEKLMTIENRVFTFQPDAVFYIGNAQEMRWSVDRLVSSIQTGVELPYGFLGDALKQADVTASMHEVLAKGRLNVQAPMIVDEVYKRVVSLCRQHHAEPVWVFVPIPTPLEALNRQKSNECRELALKSGFAVIDLTDAYRGMNMDDLRVSAIDSHPNKTGHQALAKALFTGMHESSILSSHLSDPVAKPSP